MYKCVYIHTYIHTCIRVYIAYETISLNILSFKSQHPSASQTSAPYLCISKVSTLVHLKRQHPNEPNGYITVHHSM
jgi:hypothetical protein